MYGAVELWSRRLDSTRLDSTPDDAFILFIRLIHPTLTVVDHHCFGALVACGIHRMSSLVRAVDGAGAGTGVSASGDPVSALLRSDLFVGLLQSLLYLMSSTKGWEDDAMSLEELGLLSVAEFRDAVAVVAPSYVDMKYGGRCGIVCPPLERREFGHTIFRFVSPEEGFRRMVMIRRVLVDVDRLFFDVDSSAAPYRCRKAASAIDWDGVTNLVTDEGVDFAFVFRHRDLMRFIRGIRSVGRVATGCIECDVGDDFLHFLLLYWSSSTDDSSMLQAIMAFDERDSACGRPLTEIRGCVHGSPANFFRCRYDHRDGGNGHSDGFASRSAVFRFLRRRFRSGAEYLGDVPDDYGQTIYYHRTAYM